MDHLLRMYMVQRDADHGENSKNALFWNQLFLFFKVLDYVSKTLVALFHDKAWIVVMIFDEIYDSHNHWVIECSQTTNFSFCCCLFLALFNFVANLVFESFSSICLSINFRLDLHDKGLSSFFNNFEWLIVVVISGKSCWVQQLKITYGAWK